MTIVLNPFTRRQIADSPYSHYEGDMDALPALVEANFEEQHPGYRDGVILVRVPPDGFYSSMVVLTEGQELTGSYSPRREGETPRLRVYAKGAKSPAAQVDIVLYRSDVLAEDGDNVLEAGSGGWEIISINASPVVGNVPIHPTTLMHNHFQSDGGTATNLSDADFVAMLEESFRYWADKAHCLP